MSFYQSVFNSLPEWLKRRIFPLDYGVREFVHSIPDSGSCMILDAGAGEVRFAERFNSAKFFAVDSAVGDQDWDYSKIDVLGELEVLPFSEKSFDYVINTQVLEHVKEPHTVLTELNRVLKAGGQLLLTAPQGWHEHQQPNDYYRFTQFSLRELMLKSGFHQTEILPIGGYFHYLGHRLTFIPKIIFQDNPVGLRVLLFPVELFSLALFCFFLPILCYYLDKLDRKKEFTLCYRCKAVK